ncbi:CRISPR-associated endoribonuclease Cas6 [Pleurocapsales cyanobacterium LEGE 06147]|nr:CRISPR-associated endoribonuclease Cas6 [Pleurocapsales cyanobacterium LEGE 06147]
MTRRSDKKRLLGTSWSDSWELVGLVLEVVPLAKACLFPQYVTGLHAWFLEQVRQFNPDLSAYLHDGQSEKPFTISGLEGQIVTAGKQIQLLADQTYRWYVTALSPPVVQWMGHWLEHLPETIELRHVVLKIGSVDLVSPPTTYGELFKVEKVGTLALSFITPTSFRRQGHHFPLPVPKNLFHSYLRRWNDFSGKQFDQETFLDWVDKNVLIARYQLETVKVAAGKKGSVTGFTGAIELTLASQAQQQPTFVQLFSALGQFAPYCGTGHKTTFGLGQTRLGWLSERDFCATFPQQELLARRIEQITQSLMQAQKRQGGTRALKACQTKATILARRELGESLKDIASDLEMPYETVKTYAKLARIALRAE